MFEQSFLPSGKTRKPWTISLAIAAELAIVGVLLLVPLIFVQSLPMADIASILTLPPPPPPPAPPPPPIAAKVARVTPRQFKLNVLTAPVSVPKTPVIAQAAADAPDLSASPSGVIGGIPGGVPNGMIGGVLGSIGIVAPPPPPPPPPVVTPSRIQVGGQVQAAKLIKQVLPEYPKLAHDARLGGMVRLKAVIAKDGTVQDLSVISGHPLLVPAALNAVKQWVYKPTILNGVAIEVGTEVDVTFQLST
jgi:periplasmic protein TonB